VTIRGLLIWYCCGVAGIGAAGASAYRVLARPHAPSVAEAVTPQPAPAVLATAEPAPPMPAPPLAAAPKPRRIARPHKDAAEALPLPPEPPSHQPPLRRHLVAWETPAGTPARKHVAEKAVATREPRENPLPRVIGPDFPDGEVAAAPPPPYPYYRGPANYAAVQPYYYSYYLYYRGY
jgi:hypothetical protein